MCRKVLIVGGVAGGASCAARLRRLDEDMEIILFERGEYISYANCGLPYHVGGVIGERAALLLQTPEAMRAKFNVDVRVRHEVTAIDRINKQVSVRDAEGMVYQESYDTLVLATGSSPLRPSIPGIDGKRILNIWTVPDADRVLRVVRDYGAQRAIVVGGGFIGLEMAENLRHAGLETTLVEAAQQVMAPLDYEMALLLHGELARQGVALHLGDGVALFEEKQGEGTEADTVCATLHSGKVLEADLVVLAIGVTPNSQLAARAGLEVNARGGVVTDEHMRTADPDIYAVGDVAEVEDFIDKSRAMIPLAGPANKQGRIAADNIAGGNSSYMGTQGSSIAKVFDLTAAATGLNEKALQRRGLRPGKEYESILIAQNSHAGYYPGATPMYIKLLFSADGEKIYGAQIVGRDGVDKRIDVIGTAIRLGAGVRALSELELAYAPPYSAAKDPVNMAGFVAGNVLHELVRFAPWNALDDWDVDDEDTLLLDVREDGEIKAYGFDRAVHVPLGKLRERLNELDRNKHIIVMCAFGVRAYNAARMLANYGFRDVCVYPGGSNFYRLTHPKGED